MFDLRLIIEYWFKAGKQARLIAISWPAFVVQRNSFQAL